MAITRSLACAVPSRHPGLIALGALAALILGLLAMHVLETHGQYAEHGSSGGQVAAGQVAAGQVAVDPVDVGHPVAADDLTAMAAVAPTAAAHPSCSADCDVPDPHLMASPGCVLALVSTVLVLRGSGSVGRCWTPPALSGHLTRAVGSVLPQPRPPSLIVLSISRT